MKLKHRNIPSVSSLLIAVIASASSQAHAGQLALEVSKDMRKTTGLLRAAMDIPTRTYVLNVGNWHFMGEPMLVKLDTPVSADWDFYILSTQFNIPAMRHLPFGLNSLASYRFVRFEELLDLSNDKGDHAGQPAPRSDEGPLTTVKEFLFGDDKFSLEEKDSAVPWAKNDDLHQNFNAAKKQLNNLAKNFRNEQEKDIKILSIYPTAQYLSPNFDDQTTLDIQAKPEWNGAAAGSIDWKHQQEWKYIYNLPTVAGITTRSGSASWTYYPAKKQQILFGNKTTYVLFAVRKPGHGTAATTTIQTTETTTTANPPVPPFPNQAKIPTLAGQPSNITTTSEHDHTSTTKYDAHGHLRKESIDITKLVRTTAPTVAVSTSAGPKTDTQSQPKESAPSTLKIETSSTGVVKTTRTDVTVDTVNRTTHTVTTVTVQKPLQAKETRFLRLNCFLNYELLLTAPFASARLYDEILVPLSDAVDGTADLLALRAADYSGDGITDIITKAFGQKQQNLYQLQSAGKQAFLINTQGMKEIESDGTLKDVQSPKQP